MDMHRPPLQPHGNQIFDWSESGGVWISHMLEALTARNYAGLDEEAQCQAQLAAFEKAEDEGLYAMMVQLEWKLDKQKDTDGVCNVLRDAGGYTTKT